MSARPIPARVPPPGHMIRREIEARGWTQKDLANIMDRPEKTVSEIVNGHKQITPETALQLAAAFGTSADLWLNLETNYQLFLARQAQDLSDVQRKSRLYSAVPLTEITRHGWVQTRSTLGELEQEVCEFLGVASLDERPAVAVSLRQSEAHDPEVAAEVAWVKRVEHLAREQTVDAFEQGLLYEDLPHLLTYASQAAGVTKVSDFLREHGVHFLIVPHLEQTYIDGAAFRVDDHPVIALTLRYDRIDNFWFTLLHEVAHVIAGHGEGYLDNLDEPSESPEEAEANRMAQDWLVDRGALAEFVEATRAVFLPCEDRELCCQTRTSSWHCRRTIAP